jgi:hypothetical protein
VTEDIDHNASGGASHGVARSRAGGEFFTVDRRAFANACALELNAAVAYLVVARGAGSRPFSQWSGHAIEHYTGISRSKVKLALKSLIDSQLLTLERGGTRPLYRIIQPSEVEGRELIWLPNALVDGAADERPPLALVRQMQDVRVLQLLVALYDHNNLANDGGVSRSIIYQEHELSVVREVGAITVRAFESQGTTTSVGGSPLPRSFFFTGRKDKKGKDTGWADFWAALKTLEACGLLEFVPHVFESISPEAEMLHAYALGQGGEQWERDVGEAAHNAALSLLGPEYRPWAIEHGQHFLPVPSHISKIAVIGIARLRYRPQTRMTAAWFAMSKERSQAWMKNYEAISQVPNMSSKLRGISS